MKNAWRHQYMKYTVPNQLFSIYNCYERQFLFQKIQPQTNYDSTRGRPKNVSKYQQTKIKAGASSAKLILSWD